MVEVKREHQGARADTRRCERGFDTGMAGADNDYVVLHNDESAIMTRAAPARKAEVGPLLQ